MRRLSLLILPLVFACATPENSASTGGDATFRVSPVSSAPGGAVQLSLRAGESAGQLGYNLCTSTLERRTQAGWQPVASDRICTMELRILQAAEEAVFDVQLPADLPAGEYRFLTNLELMDAGENSTVTSEPFRVEG